MMPMPSFAEEESGLQQDERYIVLYLLLLLCRCLVHATIDGQQRIGGVQEMRWATLLNTRWFYGSVY